MSFRQPFTRNNIRFCTPNEINSLSTISQTNACRFDDIQGEYIFYDENGNILPCPILEKITHPSTLPYGNLAIYKYNVPLCSPPGVGCVLNFTNGTIALGKCNILVGATLSQEINKPVIDKTSKIESDIPQSAKFQPDIEIEKQQKITKHLIAKNNKMGIIIISAIIIVLLIVMISIILIKCLARK